MALRRMATTMICLLCLLCLFGCNKEPVDTDPVDKQTAATESETQATGVKESETKTTEIKDSEIKMTGINDTRDGIIVDDLLECIDMLGKTATEIGIPREAINAERKYYISAHIDGNIFGVKGEAELLFDDVSDDRDDYLAKTLCIFTKNLNYDECKIRLSEKFCEPLGEVSIPYAKVNYGALTWTDYRFEDINIRLSSASELYHIKIEIDKKKRADLTND